MRSVILYGIIFIFFHGVLIGQHPDSTIAAQLEERARLIEKEGDLIQVTKLLHEALDKYLAALGAGHPLIPEKRLALGEAYIIIDALDDGLEQLHLALKQLQKDPTEAEKALRTYTEIARALMEKGQLRQSEIVLREALQLVNEEWGMGSAQAGAFLYYSGIAALRKKDISTAIRYMRQCLQVSLNHHPDNKRRLFAIYDQLANVYVQDARYDTAFVLYEKALGLAHAEFGPDHLAVSNALNNVGTAHQYQENYVEAVAYYEQSLKIRKEALGEKHPRVSSSLYNIAQCKRQLGAFDQAAALLSEVLEIRKAKYGLRSPLVARTYLSMGINSAMTHQYDLAGQYYNAAYQALEFDPRQAGSIARTESAYEVLNILEAHASAFYTQFVLTGENSHLDSAAWYTDLAFQIINIVRNSFADENSQAILVDRKYNIYETGMHIANATPEANRHQRAFEILERSKSAMLYNAYRRSRAQKLAGIPDSVLDLESSLKSNLIALEKRRYLAAQNATTDRGSIAELDSALFVARQEFSVLHTTLKAEYARYYSFAQEERIPSLKDVQAALGSEETLVEFFVGDTSLFLLGINHDSTVFMKIARVDVVQRAVDTLIAGLLEYHAGDQQTERRYIECDRKYRKSARILYEILIRPLELFLKEDLVIISEGQFLTVPFEVLLTSDPELPLSYKSYPFFLLEKNMSYAFSATLFLESRNSECTTGNNWLGFAPEFTEIVNSEFGFLQFNQREVSEIKQLLRGDAFLGANASREAFLTSAGDYRIIHLATHAVLEDNAEYSFIAFQPSIGSSDKLYIREIYNLPLQAELVTLSACASGRGEIVRGAGLVSIGRAFQYSGALSAIQTLWNINDQKTTELFGNFYRNLKDGATKQTALSHAKRQFLRENDHYHAHPYFWAAPVLYGNTSELYHNTTLFSWIAMALLLFGAIFWFFSSNRLKNS